MLYFSQDTYEQSFFVSTCILRIQSILVFILFLSCIPTLTFANNSISSSEPVQLLWFYKPLKDGNVNLLDKYDDFILTRNDEKYRDDLIATGVTSPILQYVRFDAIMDPGNLGCASNIQPYRNQVAWEIGDYCKLKSEHPDWFLRDNNGNEISFLTGSNRYVWMDPGNAEWRSFWLARVKDAQQKLGWHGVFLDNVEASLNKYQRKGITLKDYPDDRSLQIEVNGFLEFIYSQYFQPQGRPLQGNIIELNNTDIWFDYLENLDGAMDEAFAAGWHSGDYLNPKNWEQGLAMAEQTQAIGKQIKLVSQGDKDDMERQNLVFASYLLIAKGGASFRYTNQYNYTENWDYDNYTVDIGSPKGPRYLDGTNWRRDFSNGYVIVDPSALTSKIEIVKQSNPPAILHNHVNSLDMSYKAKGKKFITLKTKAQIVDQNDNPVAGASVTIQQVAPSGKTWVAVNNTDINGMVTLTKRYREKGMFKATITSVKATDQSYSPVDNKITDAEIFVWDNRRLAAFRRGSR